MKNSLIIRKHQTHPNERHSVMQLMVLLKTCQGQEEGQDIPEQKQYAPGLVNEELV
jgi:hypothetical protein